MSYELEKKKDFLKKVKGEFAAHQTPFLAPTFSKGLIVGISEWEKHSQ